MFDFIDERPLDKLLSDYNRRIDMIVENACERLEWIKPIPKFKGIYLHADRDQVLNAWTTKEKEAIRKSCLSNI